MLEIVISNLFYSPKRIRPPRQKNSNTFLSMSNIIKPFSFKMTRGSLLNDLGKIKLLPIAAMAYESQNQEIKMCKKIFSPKW